MGQRAPCRRVSLATRAAFAKRPLPRNSPDSPPRRTAVGNCRRQFVAAKSLGIRPRQVAEEDLAIRQRVARTSARPHIGEAFAPVGVDPGAQRISDGGLTSDIQVPRSRVPIA